MTNQNELPKEDLDELYNLVLELNKTIIDRFGGTRGLVNDGNLHHDIWDSFRLARKEKNNDDFIIKWAALSLKKLAQHHCFTDGNKRTGYALFRLILYINCKGFKKEYNECKKFIIKIADRKENEENIIKWVKKHTYDIPEKKGTLKKFIKRMISYFKK